jgi:hypothetical protein
MDVVEVFTGSQRVLAEKAEKKLFSSKNPKIFQGLLLVLTSAAYKICQKTERKINVPLLYASCVHS